MTNMTTYQTTREQDLVSEAIASRWGRSAVLLDDPSHQSVLVIGMLDDIEMERWRVLPDGRRHAWPLDTIIVCSECGELITRPDERHEFGHAPDCPLVNG